MKTLGLIGGIAPESTVDYYRSIIALYRRLTPDGSYPSILIDSIDLKKMLGFVETGDLSGATAYIVYELEKLARAGADFGLLASNTPHIVFDDIRRRSPIPLVSLVEAACDAAKALELKKVGLFGTRFTMHGRFYAEVFGRRGIEIVVPGSEDLDYIHRKYMSELVNGVYLAQTRDRMLAIAERMRDEEQINGLILGGTELPLLLRDAAGKGIPFLDTTKLHVERAVAQMLA